MKGISRLSTHVDGFGPFSKLHCLDLSGVSNFWYFKRHDTHLPPIIGLGFGLPFFATEPFLTEPIAFPGFEIGEHLFPISHLLSPVNRSLGLPILKRGT